LPNGAVDVKAFHEVAVALGLVAALTAASGLVVGVRITKPCTAPAPHPPRDPVRPPADADDGWPCRPPGPFGIIDGVIVPNGPGITHLPIIGPPIAGLPPLVDLRYNTMKSTLQS